MLSIHDDELVQDSEGVLNKNSDELVQDSKEVINTQ